MLTLGAIRHWLFRHPGAQPGMASPGRRGPVAAACLLAMCIPGQGHAQDELWVSPAMIALDGQTAFDLTREQISVTRCGVTEPVEYTIDDWHETDDAVSLQYRKAKKSKSLVLGKQRRSFHGIEVDELTATKFPGHKGKSPLVFTRPVDQRFAVRFDDWAYCATLGHYPETLDILIDPSRLAGVQAWADSLAKKGWIEPAPEGAAGSMVAYPAPANAVRVAMVFGQELRVIEDLKKQDWLIDYSMRAFPLGPPVEILMLPKGLIDYSGNPTGTALALTERMLKQAFPKLASTDYSIDIKKGTEFEVSIFAPMSKIAPNDKSYNGYWLKTKLRIFYWASGRGNADYVSMGSLQTGDGWLPKWPRADPPPANHYQMFKLSEEGVGKYNNDEVLALVQSLLTKAYVSKLNVQVIS